jgi:hypothetical protein
MLPMLPTFQTRTRTCSAVQFPGGTSMRRLPPARMPSMAAATADGTTPGSPSLHAGQHRMAAWQGRQHESRSISLTAASHRKRRCSANASSSGWGRCCPTRYSWVYGKRLCSLMHIHSWVNVRHLRPLMHLHSPLHTLLLLPT